MKWILHTDGSCMDNNPMGGPGGFGVVAIYGTVEVRYKRGYKRTTNNRMEILAVVDSLSQIEEPSTIIVHTDSQYLIDAITKWINGWVRNGWMTRNQEPVRNKDLFVTLSKLMKYHNVSFVKVKGHSGDYYNEICDQLAKDAAKNEAVFDDVGFIPRIPSDAKPRPNFNYFKRK